MQQAVSRYFLCGLLLVSGCADEAIKKEIDQRYSDAQSRFETAKSPAADRRNDPLEISDSVWLGDSAIALKSGDPLPAKWIGEGAIALRSDTPLTLNQIVSLLSTQTQIPFRLIANAQQASGGAPAAAASPLANPASGNTATTPLEDGMTFSYEGSLSGLLDLVCSYFNVNWYYKNGTVNISRYETRTFVIDALPGTITMSAQEDTAATGDAASSATAQPLANASIDIWEDINRILTNLVGTEGTLTISQSSGTIVVSTTRDRMERIADFIQEENQRLSRQVAITIEMYNVTITDTQQYALDLQPQINTGGWFGKWLDISNLSGVAINQTDIAGANLSIGLINPPGLAGSTSVFQALNSLGKTSRIAQIPMTTLNNRPATQRIATDEAYVSGTSVTIDANSGATTTEITTDKVVSGISVSVLPRLMSDGRMLLQYSLAQGAKIKLGDFTSPDKTASVQLPQTQGVSFSQQVMMKNGSTLILAGFDQSDMNDSRTSPLRGFGFFLGGTKTNDQGRNLVVIAITPREIVVNNPEAS